MGLGSLKAVGLAAARAKASQCRAQLADGIDPIAARDAERARLAIENARTITFDQCAEAFIRTHASTWRNPKHHSQWKNTLATYVSPVFGSLPVQAVDVGLVMKVLEPIWTAKPDTAARFWLRHRWLMRQLNLRSRQRHPPPYPRAPDWLSRK